MLSWLKHNCSDGIQLIKFGYPLFSHLINHSSISQGVALLRNFCITYLPDLPA